MSAEKTLEHDPEPKGSPVYDHHKAGSDVASIPSQDGSDPTEEEKNTLARVPGPIPWHAYTIAFVELCERFSYYGTIVVFTNFIQQKRPAGNRAGAGGADGQSGALGQGQRASTGLTTFNQFWVYLIPLFGAYLADEYWGRYKTIGVSLAIAIFGHCLLICCAIPSLLDHPKGALGLFCVAIIIMGLGTGGFKPNISPLVAEQASIQKMEIKTEKSGRRVILDPTLTVSRIYMYFYLFINIGALVGQLTMVYAEKYVGFWLAYLLPTAMLCLCPAVMLWGRKKYKRTPPQGSVFGKAVGLWVLGFKKTGLKGAFGKGNEFWESVKPSNIPVENRPHWMTFDDLWVDEVRRGFKACSVFLWIPLYWLTYNQLNNNLTSQAAVMKLNGLPNDVLSNLDPFALIILIPICDLIIYPALRKAGINFSPIKRIAAGFFTGSAAMIWAAVIQHYIYKKSVCGKYAAGILPGTEEDPCPPVDINVWAQTGSYILIAISEIFTSITGLEYAFTKAPKNMRSLVMAMWLFMSAISSALGEAFVSLSADPLLVWNYSVMAILAFVGGVIFHFQYRKLDAEEDSLNRQHVGHFAAHQGDEPIGVLTTTGPDEVVEKQSGGIAVASHGHLQPELRV